MFHIYENFSFKRLDYAIEYHIKEFSSIYTINIALIYLHFVSLGKFFF